MKCTLPNIMIRAIFAPAIKRYVKRRGWHCSPPSPPPLQAQPFGGPSDHIVSRLLLFWGLVIEKLREIIPIMSHERLSMSQQ
jgi:hypothetical protein